MQTVQVLSDIDRVLRHKATATDRGGGVSQEHSMVYLACIERWAPPRSPYVRQARQLAENAKTIVAWHLFEGILRALRADIAEGGLETFSEIVHGEVFADLLAHAEQLNTANYSLAAAVVAGAALEEHLRQLAQRHGVATQDSKGAPRAASALNSDLYANANAYSKAEQAQIDAWQKCRNMAAHGQPAFAQTFTQPDIQRLVEGVRDFVIKYPA